MPLRVQSSQGPSFRQLAWQLAVYSASRFGWLTWHMMHTMLGPFQAGSQKWVVPRKSSECYTKVVEKRSLQTWYFLTTKEHLLHKLIKPVPECILSGLDVCWVCIGKQLYGPCIREHPRVFQECMTLYGNMLGACQQWWFPRDVYSCRDLI